MASYPGKSDSSNSAVRAFLIEVGKEYYGKSYNHSANGSKAKELWLKIKQVDFESSCAYCGKKDERLQMEHIIGMNQRDCGLHHPGNTIPACPQCNKEASKLAEKKEICWQKRLRKICKSLEPKPTNYIIKKRINKIKDHIDKYNYPDILDEDFKLIKNTAEKLYEDVSDSCEKHFKAVDNLTIKKLK